MDLAFDREGHLFGVTTTVNPSSVPAILYRIDRATGGATKIVALVGSNSVMGLAFGRDGQLYATDFAPKSSLYLIDIETGFATAIAALPFGFSSGLELSSRNGDANDGPTSPRSGALHVTKECSAYTGLAGSFCTITSSNVKQIGVGSRVVYAKAAGATSLDTDVILYAPGPGNNTAFGHVVLDFVSARGTATFSGGTGKLTGFHASVAVSYLGGHNWAWDGTYSFSDDDDSGGRN
jgi:hypothetical protein